MNGTNRAVWQHRFKERATEILVVRHTVVLRIYMLAYLILSFSTVFLVLSTCIEKGKSECGNTLFRANGSTVKRC